MNARFASCLLAAATLAGLPASLAPAFAADPIGVEVYSSGACSEKEFLSTIQDRFRYQVRHVPELPDVAITEFLNIREVRYEPEDDRHPISRQYCEADVVLSDGQSRDIHYLIEGDMGFASIGDNVEFCVAGFDRWYVYDRACRVLR